MKVYKKHPITMSIISTCLFVVLLELIQFVLKTSYYYASGFLIGFFLRKNI